MNIDTILNLEYEGKITAEQGYRLRRLHGEGFDISPALAGPIDGYLRNSEMERSIRSGDLGKIKELIEITRQERDAEEKLLEEHLKNMNRK